MISVDEALSHVFDLVTPLSTERVALARAAGRVLAEDVTARRDQPPFAASVMDGYAVRSTDVAPGAEVKVIGEARAGEAFSGGIGPGEAVRIFTGAPVPEGADRVVIQEDVTPAGNVARFHDDLDTAPYVRPAGADFAKGFRLIAPRRLGAPEVALLAAMNAPEVPVARRPEVALIATGDELVMPGETPGPDQIIASNAFGLAAMLEGAGARSRILPIAKDDRASLRTVFGLAKGADLIVTIGGASVGDHDLVGAVAAELGMERAFYKIAMRPGKPLMAGRLDGTPMVGLPGNPVSSMVCGRLFLVPAVEAMLHLPARAAQRSVMTLAADLGPNGPREHYMRAIREGDSVRAFERQDSALLSILAAADTLIVRPPHDAPRAAGDTVEVVPFDGRV